MEEHIAKYKQIEKTKNNKFIIKKKTEDEGNLASSLSQNEETTSSIYLLII